MGLNLEMSPDVLNRLALTHARNGDPHEASLIFHQYVNQYPKSAGGWCNRGAMLLECGRVEEAMTCLQVSMEVDPALTEAHSALIMAMQYSPRFNREQVMEECRKFAWNFCQRQDTSPWFHEKDPDRVLRVGYLSADFKNHSVGRFISPLLSNHGRGFKVFFYNTGEELEPFVRRGFLHEWFDVAHRTDDDISGLIRANGIDILVDLSMHTRGGRPRVVLSRPAPVTISYLGYAGDSGLTDYYLTDSILTPQADPRALKIPSYWGYSEPPSPYPHGYGVGPQPAEKNGYVTFGCLNNFAKVSMKCLSTWGEIMAKVKSSRLILLCPPGPHRRSVFAMLGVDEKRVEFVTRTSIEEYFATHQRIDVALDPFPCGGGTTTMDAMWCGVPVVTLPMSTEVSRAGASINDAVGTTSSIAQSREDYVASAVRLAVDMPVLRMRSELRESMRSSLLMNLEAHVQSVEAAYRHAWKRFCKGDCG